MKNEISMDTLEDIVETFNDLDAKEDQLTYLMELGRSLPAMPSELKTTENKIHGCLNQAWLAERTDVDDDALHFVADSDSFIVKGLIAIMLAIYSGKTPAEIMSQEAEPIFKRIGLQREIGMQRKNGLNAVAQRIKTLAALHA